MRLYIAAPYPCRTEAQVLVAQLLAIGVTITSRWVTDDDLARVTEEWVVKDLADVDACDLLVAINPPEYHNAGTGGRHVELGYALARGKAIALIGDASNLFHHHPSVTWWLTTEAFLQSLGARR